MNWYGITAPMVQGILTSHLDNDVSVSGYVILEKFTALNMDAAVEKAKDFVKDMEENFPGITIDDVEIIEIIDKDVVKPYAVMVETEISVDGLEMEEADGVIFYASGSNAVEANKMFKETMLYGELIERGIKYKLIRLG